MGAGREEPLLRLGAATAALPPTTPGLRPPALPPQTFWHSSAHVLGQALELESGCDLTIGPCLEEGFYYDCYLGDRSFGDAEKDMVLKRMQAVSGEESGSCGA